MSSTELSAATHDAHATETAVQRHLRIRGKSQTDAINVSEVAFHAVPIGPVDWGAETVHPLYVTLKPGEISHATPIAGRMSYEDWTEAGYVSTSIPSAPPHEVIHDLIVGRIFPSSAYAMLGEFDLLPVMCEAEVLDLVGIAAPSALHIRICTDVLREHLGEPTSYRGRNCWAIFARFNDSALDEGLAETFPV